MDTASKRWQIACLLIAAIAVSAAAAVLLRNPDLLQHRGQALNQLVELLPPANRNLGRLVLTNFSEYRGNTARWSFVYFACLFGSAFCSAMAGLILKLEVLQERQQLRNDLAATLATGAALLITLLTVGNFQQKWQANRRAASGMENLMYELLKNDSDGGREQLLDQIQKINYLRNEEILNQSHLGESQPSKQMSLASSPVSRENN